jgi:hypothetical protein
MAKRDYKALAKRLLVQAKEAAEKGRKISGKVKEQILTALEESGMLGGMTREEAKKYAVRELVRAAGRSR